FTREELDTLALDDARYERWTPEQDALLVGLRLQGLSIKKLARRFRRTTGSIECRLSRLGVRLKELRRAEYLRHFRTPNHDMGEVARALGVTRHTARIAKSKLRAAGFRLPPAYHP